MKKICLVVHSLQSGGMERVMSELARYFAKKKDIKVYLILYGKSHKIFFSVPPTIKILKPEFSFTDYSRAISSIKTLFFVRKEVKKIEPDTILSLGEYWNSFVLLALWGLKAPIYISDRCQPTKSLGMLHDRLRKWLYPKASGIIVQTSTAQKVYRQQKLNKNIRVIGNPIHQISLNGQHKEEENIILTVGRLIQSKHHDRLIKIFKDLDVSGWRLIIVGGDAQKQNGLKKLKRLVEELNMQSKVEFTGTVSDIEQYYKKSKIFAFTSSSEGFPNVIGEALSAGLPAVSYDCISGPSELISHGKNGYLVDVFDDEQFGKYLLQLMEKKEIRKKMATDAVNSIQNYSKENIGSKFYQFITSHL